MLLVYNCCIEFTAMLSHGTLGSLFCLLFVAAKTVIAAPSEPNEDVKDVRDGNQIEKECKQKFGVTDDIFVFAAEGTEDSEEFDITLKDETNEDHRCFVQCLMEGSKLVTEDGQLNQHRVFQEVEAEMRREWVDDWDPDAARDIISACAKTGGEGKCMPMYRALKCLFTHTKSATH